MRLTRSGWLSRIVTVPVDTLTEKTDGELLMTLTRPGTVCSVGVNASSCVPSLKPSVADSVAAVDSCIPLRVPPELSVKLETDVTSAN